MIPEMLWTGFKNDARVGTHKIPGMKIIIIYLTVALLGGCAGSDEVYVGPRLDFTPSDGPDCKFPPPNEAQRAGKNVAETDDDAL